MMTAVESVAILIDEDTFTVNAGDQRGDVLSTLKAGHCVGNAQHLLQCFGKQKPLFSGRSGQ